MMDAFIMSSHLLLTTLLSKLFYHTLDFLCREERSAAKGAWL
jgi:hypothetical protein